MYIHMLVQFSFLTFRERNFFAVCYALTQLCVSEWFDLFRRYLFFRDRSNLCEIERKLEDYNIVYHFEVE